MHKEITLKKIDFSYSKQEKIFQNFSFSFQSGNIYCLTGPNGSAKSTLCLIIANLLKIDSGEIDYFNEILLTNKNKKKDFLAINKKVGILFQVCEKQIFNETVLEEVKYGLINFGHSDAEADSIAKKYLNLLEIDEKYYDVSPFTLSQGQKRRVCLASILCMDYEVFILDEPTINLDANTKKLLGQILLKLKQENKTIILASHDLNWAYEITDIFLLLNHGNLIYSAPKYNFFLNENVIKSFHTIPVVHQLISKLSKNKFFAFLSDLKINTIYELAEIIKGVMNNK